MQMYDSVIFRGEKPFCMTREVGWYNMYQNHVIWHHFLGLFIVRLAVTEARRKIFRTTSAGISIYQQNYVLVISDFESFQIFKINHARCKCMRVERSVSGVRHARAHILHIITCNGHKSRATLTLKAIVRVIYYFNVCIKSIFANLCGIKSWVSVAAFKAGSSDLTAPGGDFKWLFCYKFFKMTCAMFTHYH